MDLDSGKRNQRGREKRREGTSERKNGRKEGRMEREKERRKEEEKNKLMDSSCQDRSLIWYTLGKWGMGPHCPKP